MLYHFIETFPQFDFIVVCEYDVVTRFDIYALLQCMVDERLDFIGKPIWGADEGLGWKASARPYYHETMEIQGRLCCFAIFRREFVVSLQETRREHLRKLNAGDIKFPVDGAMTWPFAEAFVGAEIVRLSVPEKSISDFVETSDYDWWPPKHINEVDMSSENEIFHPVLSGNRFISSLLKYPDAISPESWLDPNSVLRKRLDNEAPSAVAPALFDAIKKRKNINAIVGLWLEFADLGWDDYSFSLVDTLLDVISPMPTGNIAFQKFAYQSSVSEWSRSQIPYEDASNAVNGNVTGNYGFHTAKEIRPWWSVDLGSYALVNQVFVFNRLPNGSERANYLSFWGSLNGRTWEHIYTRASELPFGGVDGDPLKVNFQKPVVIRFLRIELDGINYLHLDEIQILGSVLPCCI
jgi:hypothetical protein